MKVETAIFGQVGQGHGLRTCSMDLKVFDTATSRLDLPDAIPNGLNLSSYISGFTLNAYYIVARTFIDDQASRSGMVRSYALAIPLEALVHLNNINVLFNLLPSEIVEDDVFSQAITIDDRYLEKQKDNMSIGNVAELLVTTNQKPLIHVGFEEFDNLVSAIWQKLWPDMRRNFSFRMSLTPRDSEKYELVCIPENLISRWQNHSAIVNRSATPSVANAKVEAFLNGHDKYSEFCHKFGIRLESPEKVGILDQAYKKYSNLKGARFNDYLSVMRLIGSLSPNNDKGSEEKDSILQKLNELIADASIKDLLLLRNFSGTEYSKSYTLWQAVEIRLSQYNYSIKDGESIKELIESALNIDKAEESWRNSIITGLATAFNDQKSLIFENFWRWLGAFPEVAFELLKNIAISPLIENTLAINAPLKLSQEIESLLLPYFASKQLLQLHGLVLGLRYPVREAFDKQLKVDTDKSYTAGLEEIANRTDVSKLLEACTFIKQPRITQITINKAIENPFILNNVSYTNDESLFIWSKVLEKNLDAWNAPSKPKEILYSLLDDCIDSGKFNHTELITLLSNTPLADLCDYPRKSSVWRLSNLGNLNQYLEQTALSWYERALNTNFIELDKELESAVCNIKDLDEKMKQDTLNNTTAIIEIFERVSLFSEDIFIEWLSFWIEKSRYKSKTDIDRIGRLIKKRGWKKSANLVLQYSRSSAPDLISALIYCKSFFSLWDSLFIGPKDFQQKWEALTELLLELYPLGPEDEHLWSRAGGKRSFLKSIGSGQNNWLDAIEKMKKGAKPDPVDLLEEMKKDFIGNHKIALLEKLFRN
ncbi:GAP1-N1 domain-containing protein [Psychrobacter cryohalolentis]|uniref:GAP1-N1 domain-containing protein n=1 Tax=Psychrobacter cryohalolentis TaxID=330922 RepID=UPI003F82C3C5